MLGHDVVKCCVRKICTYSAGSKRGVGARAPFIEILKFIFSLITANTRWRAGSAYDVYEKTPLVTAWLEQLKAEGDLGG